MQIFIFLTEVILIAFLLDLDIMELNSTAPKEEYFSSYSSLNSSGESILFIQEIPDDQKLSAWEHSPLKEEMLLCFPHVEQMRMLIENNIIGDEAFKQRLIAYIENVHGAYLAQELSYDEFKRAVSYPDPKLPAF